MNPPQDHQDVVLNVIHFMAKNQSYMVAPFSQIAVSEFAISICDVGTNTME
jgi:hypothetical protein